MDNSRRSVCVRLLGGFDAGGGGEMTDLEINIALAQAMGWTPASKYAVMHNQFNVFRQKVICNKDGVLRRFDYRDPVIFMAICKHWQLTVENEFRYVHTKYAFSSHLDDTIEKAAALCVIDAVNRGAK